MERFIGSLPVAVRKEKLTYRVWLNPGDRESCETAVRFLHNCGVKAKARQDSGNDSVWTVCLPEGFHQTDVVWPGDAITFLATARGAYQFSVITYRRKDFWFRYHWRIGSHVSERAGSGARG